MRCNFGARGSTEIRSWWPIWMTKAEGLTENSIHFSGQYMWENAKRKKKDSKIYPYLLWNVDTAQSGLESHFLCDLPNVPEIVVQQPRPGVSKLHSLSATSSQLPAFCKYSFFWGHSHSHSFMYCLWLLSCHSSRS